MAKYECYPGIKPKTIFTILKMQFMTCSNELAVRSLVKDTVEVTYNGLCEKEHTVKRKKSRELFSLFFFCRVSKFLTIFLSYRTMKCRLFLTEIRVFLSLSSITLFLYN